MMADKQPLIPAVAYARVSTESQVDDELPITAQLDEVKRFAAARGMEIVEEFIDAGITGRTEDRPEFARLRKIISSGKARFQAVIVWRSNRFARSTRIAQGFRFLLEQKNIRLFSVTEPEMNGSIGVLMNGILDAFNEFYSAQLGEDSFRGMVAAARAGYAVGGTTPYGMRRVPVTLDSGSVKKKYEPHPIESLIVKRIYEMYADGRGLYQIARLLNLDGIKTKMGQEWKLSAIHSVLFKNRLYYLGHMIFNRTKTMIKKRVANKPPEDWIVTENTHEAVITQEMADAVDRRAAMKQKPNFQRERSLLNGLIYCGLCGKRFTGSRVKSGKNGKKNYYGCTARKQSLKADKSGLCSNAYVRQEIIEDAVLAEIRKNYCNPAVLKTVLAEIEAELYQGEGDKAARARQLRAERAEQEKRRGRLLDAVEQGMLPLEDVSERILKVKNRIREIDLLLEELDTHAPIQFKPDLDLEDVAQKISIVLEDPQQRREVFLSFIERIDIFLEHIEVKFRLPFLPSKKGSGDGSEGPKKNSSLIMHRGRPRRDKLWNNNRLHGQRQRLLFRRQLLRRRPRRDELWNNKRRLQGQRQRLLLGLLHHHLLPRIPLLRGRPRRV
jgi:DNA invertase Pin-like site-specific DNA recombinase